MHRLNSVVHWNWSRTITVPSSLRVNVEVDMTKTGKTTLRREFWADSSRSTYAVTTSSILIYQRIHNGLLVLGLVHQTSHIFLQSVYSQHNHFRWNENNQMSHFFCGGKRVNTGKNCPLVRFFRILIQNWLLSFPQATNIIEFSHHCSNDEPLLEWWKWTITVILVVLIMKNPYPFSTIDFWRKLNIVSNFGLLGKHKFRFFGLYL